MFDLVLQDSVLFPEGGGQPCDYGAINGAAVRRVRRCGDLCVISSPVYFEEGSEVKVEVDWPRRADHMEHHSAQHLLSAILERELGLPTESWSLSHPSCFIQVPQSMVPPDDLSRVENICNECIGQSVPVKLRVYACRNEVPEGRSRGIPHDVTGPIRVIDIDGIDSCTCCGTHVSNLSALRYVKILYQESKGKTCKIHFVTGQRAIGMFSSMYARERFLVKALGTNAEALTEAVARRGKDLAATTKALKKLKSELVQLMIPQALVTARSFSHGEVYLFYHSDMDMDDLRPLVDILRQEEPDRVAAVASGSDGQFIVIGPSDRVRETSAIICTLLEGKGGLSALGFRGKGNLKKWSEVEKALGN
jgi:alanyl-tRNA synthetase/misacylated tRNA(Ala) deacylase